MTSSRILARVCVFSLALSSPLAAQTLSTSGPTAPSSDPAYTLSENLKALARDPYNVDALVQAGQGALNVGDPNAAFGFFARAEELSPSNARAKAGLGSALTMMEKPRDALRAFDEATALGISEAAILADRGLAHDLSGDTKKAQKDYLSALRNTPSDEVTRRLALSLGASGEKDAALARLDPLIRRNDQAAWRARAFILAMNGDVAGAEKIVRMVAPSGTASSMLSFMQRLAGLNQAARASAVHFGTLPANGTSLAAIAGADDFRPVDSSAAARLATPSVERASVVPTVPVSAKEARRRAREEEKLAKLAAKGRQASERASAPTVSAPTTSPQIAARVAAALPAPGDKIVVLKGAKSLPLPDAVAARSGGSSNATPSSASSTDPRFTAPLPAAKPAPLFEVPAPAPKQPTPVQSTPVQPAPTLTASSGVRDPAPTSSTAVPKVVEIASNTPVSASVSTGSVVAANVTAPAASIPTLIEPVALPPAHVAQQSAPTLAAPQVETVQAPKPSPIQTASQSVDEAAAPTPTHMQGAPEAVAPPASPPAPAVSLADIVSTLELEQESAAAPLPDAAQLRAARIAAQKKAAADEKLKAEKLAEEKRVAEEEANARRNPARVWVQIATGNNRAGLPGTWRKLKEQASKSLARQSAWTVPFRQTNRLLVGPLKSVADARELVNSLGKEGVQATTFSSEAGQEISRIGGK